MINIIGKKKIWFGVSGALLAVSLAALILWGLKLGIDFTGGSILELHFLAGRPENVRISEVLKEQGIEGAAIQPVEESDLLIRTKALSEPEHQKIVAALHESFKNSDNHKVLEEKGFESVGPTIGAELKSKAILALVLVLLAIIAYIAFAFRKVSEPVASWKYGVCAVAALFHDVLIPTGVFALLGKFLGYEVDTLFVTAILTVLGFSVHDTIVVFDRIRENLIKHTAKTFEETVNLSVNETITRSINTSLTVLLVLLSVYFFGGASTRNFVLVLILGIVFGTYSSIFIASPLLVAWHNRQKRGK
ncbi:protein translocase subunit SecF [Patescibacteria group bacterium]|nr:MAG: protein translocase subunit SecF [Patescibacteria group bacterium]